METKTRNAFFGAFVLRLVLVLYGEWQDANFRVKYTDIDYNVYTDAARIMHSGGSPFERATYRYTYLLAFVCIPNIWFAAWGKLLFIACDLVVGWLLNQLLCWSYPSVTAFNMNTSVTRKLSDSTRLILVCSWLFNPLSFTVSTRGNADVLVILMVLGCLYALLLRKYTWASILYGLSVHFKIYPIVYCLTLLVFVQAQERFDRRVRNDENENKGNSFSLKEATHSSPKGFTRKAAFSFSLPSSSPKKTGLDQAHHPHHSSPPLRNRLPAGRQSSTKSDSIESSRNQKGNLLSPIWHLQLKCLFVGAGTFIVLTYIGFLLYGYTFVYETYLYHLIRKDNRHNFSVFFYQIYLQFDQATSIILSVAAFVPQIILNLNFLMHFRSICSSISSSSWSLSQSSSLTTSRQLSFFFCIFGQTYSFVIFNKVCTAQYFIWYLSLLPLVIPSCIGHESGLTVEQGVTFVILWACSEAHWLQWAYQLEFLGNNTFLWIWIASLLFFLVNVFILASFAKAHRP